MSNALANRITATAALCGANRACNCGLQRTVDGTVYVPGSLQESHRSQDATTAWLHQRESSACMVHCRQWDQLHRNGQLNLHAGNALPMDVSSKIWRSSHVMLTKILYSLQQWLPFGHHVATLRVPGHVWCGSILLGLSGNWSAQVLHIGRDVPGSINWYNTHSTAGCGTSGWFRLRNTYVQKHKKI